MFRAAWTKRGAHDVSFATSQNRGVAKCSSTYFAGIVITNGPFSNGT